MKSGCKPRIALVLGDPAGIGPELLARLLAEPETGHAADLLVIAGHRAFEEGMRSAGCQPRYAEAGTLERLDFSAGLPLLHDPGGLPDNDEWHGRIGADSGRYCLQTLSVALELTRRGITDALVFGPLNKHALHMAGMQSSDELHWFAQRLAHDGPVCEFNVLDDLWTSRVTSHIALKEVPAMITREGVLKAIGLIHDTLLKSGCATPRIAVCGLNPHNGDNGSFGREEIDIIAPAVEQARSCGLTVEGPFAADTIFLKVQGGRRDYDAIVTMYHDQGQIAMKLMGFSRGVTVQGGLPVPILTPAHGTAVDIAGSGVADAGAIRAAFSLACDMAKTGLQQMTQTGCSSTGPLM
jgi:4-hydroxythreonine-4-phosphate dehydrogenase